MWGIVAAVTGDLLANETRKRVRRTADQKRFEGTVEAVVCDVAYHHLAALDGEGVSTPRNNNEVSRRSRYRPDAINSRLPDILDDLAERHWIRQSIAPRGTYTWPRVQTTVWAGPRLIERLADLDFADFALRQGHETIVLKSSPDGSGRKVRVEYPETDLTRRLRAEVAAVNEWLSQAELEFDDAAPDAAPVDTDDRWMRRVFTRDSFESGGRLFGGFWQRLSKVHRAAGLSIAGETIVTLDYGQMALRILYGIEGQTPPEGDLYRVRGLEGYREGVKKLINALLFGDPSRNRMPKGVRRLIPEDVRYCDAVAAIHARHPLVAKHFDTDIGHKVQFVESSILMDVLASLRQTGIVGLPLHDAVAVGASDAADAEAVMMAVFRQQTGAEGVVSKH